MKFEEKQESWKKTQEAAIKILEIAVTMNLTQRELEGAIDLMKDIAHLSVNK